MVLVRCGTMESRNHGTLVITQGDEMATKNKGKSQDTSEKIARVEKVLSMTAALHQELLLEAAQGGFSTVQKYILDIINKRKVKK
jgi:hypothetical protein